MIIYIEGFGERIKELGRFVGWVVLGIFEVDYYIKEREKERFMFWFLLK